MAPDAHPRNSSNIVVFAPKSQGIGLLLTFLLGPIGLLYATTLGGIILVPIAFVVGIFTFGIGALITWPIAVIWSIIAISMHNRKTQKNLTQSRPEAD